MRWPAPGLGVLMKSTGLSTLQTMLMRPAFRPATTTEWQAETAVLGFAPGKTSTQSVEVFFRSGTTPGTNVFEGADFVNSGFIR